MRLQMKLRSCKHSQNLSVGSYLLLNTIFHWLYSVVLSIFFCAKSIVIFVRSIVLLANLEARKMRYHRTQNLNLKRPLHLSLDNEVKMTSERRAKSS